MNFYIASKLENVARVRELAQELENWGWKCTYKWFKHGSVFGEEQLQATAAEELAGAIRAQLVIVLLPGGRGTHTELGLALAHGKEIVLHSEEPEVFNSEARETCSFYWLPGVERVCCPFHEFPSWLKQKYTVVLKW